MELRVRICPREQPAKSPKFGDLHLTRVNTLTWEQGEQGSGLLRGPVCI